MILGFKKEIEGVPTYFPQKILACISDVYAADFAPKRHTIRAGHRWKEGDIIHMATGVRSKNYVRFNEGIEQLEKVKSVQKIHIEWENDEPAVFIDGRMLYCQHLDIDKGMEQLAINDGFDTIEDFFAWFNKDFDGQIIHWTELRYEFETVMYNPADFDLV